MKYILLLFILFFLYNCAEKTIYSGKIINQESFDYSNIKNKNELIQKFGNANYIDPIENKFFYYTEKRTYKSLLDEKLTKRIILVFNFEADNSIKSVEEYTLNDENKFEHSKDKTTNNLVKQGIIEKLFGGVGKGPLPTN